MAHHVVPLRVYFLVFVTLLLMTLVTVDVAFYNLGILSTPIALAIACTKALLVILFFMHVKYSSRLTWIFAGIGFVFLAILILLTLADMFTRPWQSQPDGKVVAPLASLHDGNDMGL